MNQIMRDYVILTAGSAYLDIDAYACCVAMSELLNLKGETAIAYSCAPSNYSVCKSLMTEGELANELPPDCQVETAKYIIVDVSDPDFIKDAVLLDQVTEVYDHHVGFEEYWKSRIGKKSHIEFIGAAATLIYREWKKCGLQDKMSRPTALLLIAAILDNTLNLTSSNTTQEDIETFNALCQKENISEEWCAAYFSEVQTSVEADLKNALFGDIKYNSSHEILPSRVAQLCVWDADRIIQKLPIIRQWFHEADTTWMINIIDVHRQCSYFICDDAYHQKEFERIFNIGFESGVAKTAASYLRKEIIKKVYSYQSRGKNYD